MAVIPIPSSTVVVLRDAPEAPEILLVRRHEESGTFSGASVFPGGMLDPGDEAADLAPPESRFDEAAARAALGEALPPSSIRALHVAAIRELFEEAGLLLARDRRGRWASAEALVALEPERGGLQDGSGSPLARLLERAGLVLALDALVPFARWITPEFQPKRWDTRFFLATAPPGQEARCDGTETCEAIWLRADEALAAYRSGEHLLAPPTFRVLEDLSRFRSAGEAFAAARAAGPPPTILPVPLRDAPTPTLVYPGDAEYPPASGGEGRNRVVLEDGRWRSVR